MFGRLRWLVVVLPIVVVAVIEVLSDTVLDEVLPFPFDALLVMSIVLALAFAFSHLAFRRLDALAGDLETRNAELERRNATVRALNQVNLAIAGISGLDRILQAVVDHARALLVADGAVLLVDDGSGGRVARATSGRPIEGLAGARIEVPLQRQGRTVGSLAVGAVGARSYDADDLETLGTLASQAAIAIENARLQERLREVAIVEERTRIAREMHDGLAQVLGYVNTKSQAVEGLLESGRLPEARTQLQQLASAARSIYVDVREAILGLRSTIDPATGFVAAIEEYAARFAEASKLAVEVRASAAARAVEVDEPVERHAFRVVQESLTNIRKHAAAGRVRIDVDVEPAAGSDAPQAAGPDSQRPGAAAASTRAARLVIRVADDGTGMPASPGRTPDWPHYGIAAMRERAAAVGGSIDWLPLEPHGTEVRLLVPIEAAPARQPDAAPAVEASVVVPAPRPVPGSAIRDPEPAARGAGVQPVRSTPARGR